MYRSNMRFSLFFCALCLITMDTMAAPSVRVLGTNNSGTKVVPAKTGENINRSATIGTVKKASVKNAGVTSSQKVLSPGTERVATISTGGRLPVISTKTIQTAVKPGTATVNTNTSAAKFDEVNDRIDGLENKVDTKADILELEKYYTKEEIDNIKSGYYTSGEVDEKISNIDTIISGDGETLPGIVGRVTQNEADIARINTVISGDGETVVGLSGRVAQNEADIDDLKTAVNGIDTSIVSQVQTQISGLSERITNNDNQIVTINGQIDTLGARIDDIDLISSIQHIRDLQQTVRDYGGMIRGYEVQLGQMSEKVTDVVARSKTIYDANTDAYKTPRIASVFDVAVLTEND